MDLHVGSIVALAEWRCPGHDHAAGAAEIGDAYEIVVARRGVFAREGDGHRVVSDAGTATFWHPAEPYRITHPVPGGDYCSIVRLSADGVRALVATVDPARAEAAVPRFPIASVPLSGPSYLLHWLAMAAARDAARQSGTALGTSPLRAEEYGVAFAAAAVAAAGQARKAGRLPRAAARNRRAVEYAARVREYIAPRYRQPLTLRGIATAVGCSPYHLSRLVSATSGVPIYGLVIELRLRHALELLLETKDDIRRSRSTPDSRRTVTFPTPSVESSDSRRG